MPVDHSAKILKDVNTVWGFIGGLAAGIIYVSNTFATYKYVDDKHSDAIQHSDQNRAAMSTEIKGVTGMLGQIMDSVKTIESRTWDMQRAPATATINVPAMVSNSKK